MSYIHSNFVSNFMGEVNSKDNIIQLCPNCHWEFDKGLLSLQQIRVPSVGVEPTFSSIMHI